MPDERPLTEVAVGLVFDHRGRVLLGQRPAGKPYAGWWEFPGGKLEAGESVAAALARELHEELGIRVRSSTPWIVREHSYPHARVRLHFRRVFDWYGEPVAREGQAFGWTRPDAIDREPLLPATVPILAMLALPGRVVGMALERIGERRMSGRLTGEGGSGATGAPGARRSRILLVADLGDEARGAGSRRPARTHGRDPALCRLRAVPGALVCAGERLAARLGAELPPFALDGIVAGPHALPPRTGAAGLRGLRITRVQELGLLQEVDADFAILTMDVSAHSLAFEAALAGTAMPVYLIVGDGRNPGPHPPGLQGTASGYWPDG